MNNLFGATASDQNPESVRHTQEVPHNAHAQITSNQVPRSNQPGERWPYLKNLRKIESCSETTPLRKASFPHLEIEEDDRLRQRKASETFLYLQLQKPLEERLLESGLLSTSQLALIRMDQQNQSDLSITEILRLRNWHSETILDFFINLELAVNETFRSLSIGQRLKTIGLLNDEQLGIALEYKRRANIRLGHAIFLSGVLSQATVDYFAQL